MTKLILSMSALAPSQYRKYVKGWDKGRYADLFAKYNGDRNGYRIYLPLDGKPTSIAVPKSVQEALHSKGYVVDDYRAGMAVDSTGKRKIRIGKLLPPELQQVFANDPVRQAKSDAYTVVISRHPYDIAGMSTGRGWTSCMNLNGGINSRYVEKDVAQGSIIAYLVPSSDPNIKNPAARILLRVYRAGRKKGLWPSGIYGTGNPQFYATVRKWCSQVNAEYFGIPYGASMNLIRGLYDDSGDTGNVVNIPPDFAAVLQGIKKCLSAKASDKNTITLHALCTEALAEDPVKFFETTSEYSEKELWLLNDYITPHVLSRALRINIDLPSISRGVLGPIDLYCAFVVNYWSDKCELNATVIGKMMGSLLDAYGVDAISRSRLLRASKVCDWTSQQTLKTIRRIPTEVIRDYKEYGIPAFALALILSRAQDLVMPDRVDPKLVQAIRAYEQNVPTLSRALVHVGDPEVVLKKMIARTNWIEDSELFIAAVNRLSDAQLSSFIKSRGNVLDVMHYPYDWSDTKWATKIGELAFDALYTRPDVVEHMSSRSGTYPTCNAVLLMTARQVSTLGNSAHDISFTACLLASTWKSTRQIAEDIAERGLHAVPKNILAFAWPSPVPAPIPTAINGWLKIPNDVRKTLMANIASIVGRHYINNVVMSQHASGAHALLMPWILSGMDDRRLTEILTVNNIDRDDVDSLIKHI